MHEIERTDAQRQTEQEVDVSIILPCLNEVDAVGICVGKALRAFEGQGLSCEVVVVDNASSDGSADAAARAGAHVVHEACRGYGAACRRGFSAARGRYFVMGDADDSYDFTAVLRFVEPLTRGADMVMGTRLKGDIIPGAMPWMHRWIGNPILSGMLRLMFKTSVSDAHCGLRSITRDAYRRINLRTEGMEFASEMVVNALREGLHIEEIPIAYHPRIGVSKLSGLRDAWRHVRFMLIYSPSYLFQLPGLCLVLFGGLIISLLARGPFEAFGHAWDMHVLLFGALALILGYNLVLFDVLAKTFSMGAGLAKPGRWLSVLTSGFRLERGLIIGVLFVLIGAAIEGAVIFEWIRVGYGELMEIRAVVVGMTAMVLGAQTIFASFLVSLMLIQRR